MQGRSRKRFPTQEELELWSRVTRHDEPLARPRAVAFRESELPGSVPADQTLIGSPEKEKPRPTRSPKSAKQSKTKPISEAPLPAPFDPRVSKRIARGHHEIDARLDLHGLRKQDAYVALHRFLAHAQAKGHRHVLIITGKGKAEPDIDRDFWTSEERGVLRRLVPHWLREPSLRLHVVSFTESALKHGGTGALYVTIRKSSHHHSGKG